MNAESLRPKIAVLESQASNRLHWMLDSRWDGRSWTERGSSYEQRNTSQNRNREGWQKLLEDLHYDYRHISPSLLTGPLIKQFEVLILPRAIALSDAEIQAIKEFA